MNRTMLKSYAPQARRDFIQAITDRAAFYGLTAKKIETVVESGDVAVIAGREHPRSIVKKRKLLEARIESNGFGQTMEAIAYTWFNRFVAIRFMELHGYLDHGYRVLSHPAGKSIPEIIEQAEHVDFPGLKKETVIDLKLAGNKEAELYRLLLIAQCNALHAAMPFLFERLDDETELLLPDNLLNSDSVIRKLVTEINEDDWKEVEIIGWLYQFYISEKKAQVIGKVVATEDIPAATQLFTPNWIVKYLVHNTLGRQWLATYPQSSLRKQMEYYIEPAEQTSEVQEQLKAITPTSLNPEELTLLDPACGSGHILVEAYDLLKAIYLERGYRAKDIPALILQKNLFGLEIDDRAAQLASFALMMKARADDRRIFESEAKPNVLAFVESKGMEAADITQTLNASYPTIGEGNIDQSDIKSLITLFENAKTFGSLIQVPAELILKLPEIAQRLKNVTKHGDLMSRTIHVAWPLVHQARLLAQQYSGVVANPPYMGGKQGMNPSLKEFVTKNHPNNKSDLFAAFVERLAGLVLPNCFLGLMTPFTWMFIQSYEALRRFILEEHALVSLIQPEYHAFFESAFVPICAYIVQSSRIPINGDFIRLTSFYGEELQFQKTLEAIKNPACGWRYSASVNDFNKVPGIPIAYWVSDTFRAAFKDGRPLGELSSPRQGMATSDNDRFLRFWQEVPFWKIGFGCESNAKAGFSGKKWFPYNKGGPFRKWYGNNSYVVNWENSGKEILEFAAALYGSPTRTIKNISRYFQPCITWSALSSGGISLRKCDVGFIFDTKGQCLFSDSEDDLFLFMALLNSSVVKSILTVLSPTLDFNSGTIAKVPCLQFQNRSKIIANAKAATMLAVADWNLHETSWAFDRSPLVEKDLGEEHIQSSFSRFEQSCKERIQAMKRIETDNNELLIGAYGLHDELESDVLEGQITLYRPDRSEDIRRLISFAIGCIMGRYSLDKPGLIYANSGNQDFDPTQYQRFRSDEDGIITLFSTDWGIRDDAMNRFVEFIATVWPKKHLEENLKYVADSLAPESGIQPRETIRRYFSAGFYKHHLALYKRRPIYWLFSSGKQRAFQCLVYLHRYNEGTLARMRTEYVIPLQGQIASRIDQLEGDKAQATSTSHRKKLQKEQDDLKKQQTELLAFDEKLKHFADQRIRLDLDDGVKVNYGKFGDLLAEVKAVTGGKDDE